MQAYTEFPEHITFDTAKKYSYKPAQSLFCIQME